MACWQKPCRYKIDPFVASLNIEVDNISVDIHDDQGIQDYSWKTLQGCVVIIINII